MLLCNEPFRVNRNPVVKFSFSKTVTGQQLAPEVAYFSSRGPSSLSPSVLKVLAFFFLREVTRPFLLTCHCILQPDIAAPGVDILASWSPASSSKPLDSPQNKASPFNFKLDSGTSMACPHISGIVALLKGIHPTWSPAAIKSALVTTGKTQKIYGILVCSYNLLMQLFSFHLACEASVTDEYGQNTVAEGAPHKQADPFDYGGGHVDPNKALSPGLIYDMEISDYVCFLYAMGYNSTAISLMTRVRTPCRKSAKVLLNLNLPSITIPELKQRLTVSRTVTNVGPINSVYFARVQAPAGTHVSVKPSNLSFNSTTKKLKFKVTICSQLKVQGRYSFGNLYWEDGIHVVRIPLTVRIIINDYFYTET